MAGVALTEADEPDVNRGLGFRDASATRGPRFVLLSRGDRCKAEHHNNDEKFHPSVLNRKLSNAAHHAPPHEPAEDESRRVGGRVHALVMVQRKVAAARARRSKAKSHCWKPAAPVRRE
jgi:hypothetical protein